jgi:hypothetical protein
MSPKTVRILTIITEIFWVVILTNGYIRRGLPTSKIYWIAAVIEISLGLVVCLFYKRYLNDQRYKKWNILTNVVSLMGFVIPIILYYTADFLKPVGSTWIFSLLTFNTYYVYRIIKKQPIAQQNVSSTRYIIVAKVLHWLVLVAILTMVIVIIVFTIIGKTHVIGKEPILEAIFTIVGVPFLSLGILFPLIVKRLWKSEKSDYAVYFIYAIQISLFATVALMGLIIGITDGLLYVSFPLLLVAGIALACNFPTVNHWEEWKARVRT